MGALGGSWSRDDEAIPSLSRDHSVCSVSSLGPRETRGTRSLVVTNSSLCVSSGPHGNVLWKISLSGVYHWDPLLAPAPGGQKLSILDPVVGAWSGISGQREVDWGEGVKVGLVPLVSGHHLWVGGSHVHYYFLFTSLRVLPGLMDWQGHQEKQHSPSPPFLLFKPALQLDDTAVTNVWLPIKWY